MRSRNRSRRCTPRAFGVCPDRWRNPIPAAKVAFARKSASSCRIPHRRTPAALRRAPVDRPPVRWRPRRRQFWPTRASPAPASSAGRSTTTTSFARAFPGAGYGPGRRNGCGRRRAIRPCIDKRCAITGDIGEMPVETAFCDIQTIAQPVDLQRRDALFGEDLEAALSQSSTVNRLVAVPARSMAITITLRRIVMQQAAPRIRH
jgi:hypothetical protein